VGLINAGSQTAAFVVHGEKDFIGQRLTALARSEAEFLALHEKLPPDYPSSTEPNARLKGIWAAIHGLGEKRAALCISGGGIRSATFGLGILQGLARCGLLHKFHYLSTVSGGGYIGAWLGAWIHRADGGITSVAAELARPRDASSAT
jgi:hypothetical protein